MIELLNRNATAMRLALIIPDGVGARNFIAGAFVPDMHGDVDIHILHKMPDQLLEMYQERVQDSVADWHELVPVRERALPFTLRNCLRYAQMYWVDNFPMRVVRDRRVEGSWKTKASLRVANLVGRIAASPRPIKWLERSHSFFASRSQEVAKYTELFKEIRPTVLFCSNQRGPVVIPAVLAAKSLGIPTATFIFSWDNLSSKTRIAAPFDHFLLWSDHMKDELLRFYPDVKEAQTHVVGTPQFDPYGDEDLLWTREKFCQKFGADPNRKIICYSGGDVGNSKEDHHHVRILMELIKSGHIRGNPQVILRPAPVDEGSRYQPVCRDHPELIYAPPAWLNAESANWSAVVPLPEDIQILANLTNHADMNINFASTMTLDFAIRDKPVINVMIDTSDPPSYGVSQWDFVRQFEHYQPVIDLGAARFARSVDDLANHVNDYLEDPSLDRDGRRRFVDLEVGIPVGQSCDRIMDVLQKIQLSNEE